MLWMVLLIINVFSMNKFSITFVLSLMLKLRIPILVFIAFPILFFCSCLDECDLYLTSDQGYISIDVMISTADTVQYAYVRRSYDSTVHPDTARLYGWNTKNLLYFPYVDCVVTLKDIDINAEYVFEEMDYHSSHVYCLNNFTPVVGHTYMVNVEVEGKSYQSTQTIRKGPIIDKFGFKPYSTSDENDLYRPIVYITDPCPEETDYYLFVNDLGHNCFVRTGIESYYMPISLLTDEGMDDMKGGIELSLGMGAYENEKGTGIGSSFSFEVMSISKQNYDFFTEMEKQITTDGGVYTPSPVSPPTNFSGEKVMGQFIATDSKVYHFDIYDLIAER